MRFFKPKIRPKKFAGSGFTLIELLISVAVFAIFLVSVVTVMIDMQQGSRRINLEEQVYQDMRAMMKQITNLIEDNAIDYEEYFRVTMGGADFGDNYGDYQQSFYDFGTDDAPGVFCNDHTNTPDDLGFEDCLIDKTTIDRNMGQYPGTGDPAKANAFCSVGCVDPTDPNLHLQSRLYVINERGDKKTFLVLEEINKGTLTEPIVENVISTAWLNGEDTDGDDITDIWELGEEFLPAVGLANDLIDASEREEMYQDFIPISPLRTQIVNLQFFINPLEDPYKGFAETGTDVMQPSVTVILTAEPSQTVLQDYRGALPQKTIQTTIFSDVRKNVESF